MYFPGTAKIEQHRKNLEKLDNRDRSILGLTGFGHFMAHVNMLVFPAILIPLSSSLKMEVTDVLGLSFWMYLLFGITAFPWGLAADRWGARKLLLVFYLGAGISSFSAALLIDSPTGLVLSLAGLGLFSGIYHPAGLGLISKEIKRISLAMGYNGMCGNFGLAAAPFIAGTVNWLWGPQAVYFCLMGFNLSGLGLIFLSSNHEKMAQNENEAPESNGQLTPFLILLVAMMLGGIAYRGSTVIIPAYFELKTPDIFQWLNSQFGGELSKNLVATSITSAIYLVGMIGQFTGGRLAEKFDLRFGYLIFHSITVPAVFFMSMSMNLPLISLALLYNFFLLGMQPIENTLVSIYTPKQFRHSAYGLKFVLTFGVGAFAVKTVEYISKHYSMESVFVVLSGVSLLLVGTIVLLILKTK